MNLTEELAGNDLHYRQKEDNLTDLRKKSTCFRPGNIADAADLQVDST